MPIVKKLIDRIEERKDDDGKLPKLVDIFAPLWDAVADGDIDTDDYPVLVAQFKEAIAYAIPLINVPKMPDRLEPMLFDSWAIPLLQGFADEIVAFVYSRFNIPLPPE